MKFFVLRHKASGKIIPQQAGNSKTWWDPRGRYGKVPRLFYRLTDAKNAKRMWEGGCLERHTVSPRNDFLGDGIDTVKYSTQYGLDRKTDDLEILEVTLTLGATP